VGIVQNHLDESFLEWLTRVAPIRIGFINESIVGNPEGLGPHSYPEKRRSELGKRLDTFTHVLAVDERDAEDISAGTGSVDVVPYDSP